jgi:hypothetical protein
MRVRPGLWVAVLLSIILWSLIYFIAREYAHPRTRSEIDVPHNDSARCINTPDFRSSEPWSPASG